MKTNNILLAVVASLMMSGIAEAQIINPGDKVLVAYFSKSGNTKEFARQIQEQTGADIFEIVPIDAYPDEYRATTEQAKKEINAGYQPTLKNKPTSLKEYDIVFVGSPCWWSTIAPPVATFLSENDFSGKTIVPFMTDGGSGLGHSVADIKKLVPGAKVEKGKAISGKSVKSSSDEVKKWLKGL